jgi:hypothetical protein
VDYFGNENPPLAKDFAQQFVPFTARNIKQRGSKQGAVESVLGVNPAPADVTRTPAMKKALEGMDHHKLSAAEAETAQAKRDMIRGAMHDGGKEALAKTLDAEVKAGRMTPRQAKDTLTLATKEPLVRYTASDPLEKKLGVWNETKAAERTPAFTAAMHKSLGSALENVPLNDLPKLVAEAKAAGLDTGIAEAALAKGKQEALHGGNRAYEYLALKMTGQTKEAAKMRENINKLADGNEPESGPRLAAYKAAQFAREFLRGR